VLLFVVLRKGDWCSCSSSSEPCWLPKSEESVDVWWKSGGTSWEPRDSRISSRASVCLVRAVSHSWMVSSIQGHIEQKERSVRESAFALEHVSLQLFWLHSLRAT
jgi:hypothetical protein